MEACVIHGALDLRLDKVKEPELSDNYVKVRIRAGGICGSDLHYFSNGRIGDFIIREPLIPGHEVAGEVCAVGAKVSTLKPGDRVAIHPGRSCGRCPRCREGRPNLCQSVFYMGSASRFPHMQGGFCEFVSVDESQCHKISTDIAFPLIAFAEPLSVALHAVHRAGDIMGRKVLITGAGPIGQLLLLAARRAGAGDVVVTDLLDSSLGKARQIGAAATINVGRTPDALTETSRAIDGFDVAFEVSGAAPALNSAIDAVHPGATIVQVGSLPAGPQGVTANRIMAKELDVRGAFRFGNVFADAVACLEKGLIDVSPLLTAVVPMANAGEAFLMAKDREHHLKVVIEF
ncbi:L-idonate 5-dehydrogenase [Telmatospirillum siberiense]|uniref:L-idonate 5-dehydrogenase n=1 Tax=Telmatospirillum siberiense TaxID=382514 RepID=A0A2N3PYY5_9PROT|nr:L-idonate 5-dehydrogenase [Telmatospirillum siberiense]PKU25632.1 L-idonate 5-dehydrogenase [Telmatospirillum siberiense]